MPSKLSIAGFDDIFGSDFTAPALTTVRAPLTEAGERAVRYLLSRVSPHAESGRVDVEALLPTELVVRGSTGHHVADGDS